MEKSSKESLKMSKSKEINDTNELKEKALDTQRSVGVVTELVDAVHRHKIAAKTSQVALTTEVNELKQKHKTLTKCAKNLIKAQKKGKIGTLGDLAKGVTDSLFNKEGSDLEALGKEVNKKEPSAPDAEQKDEPPPSYDMRIEANVTDAELAEGKARWAESVMQARDEAKRLRQVQAAVMGKKGGPTVVGMRMLDERERNLSELQDAAIAAKVQYDRLKEEYAQEVQREKSGMSITTTPGTHYRSRHESEDEQSDFGTPRRVTMADASMMAGSPMEDESSRGPADTSRPIYPKLPESDEEEDPKRKEEIPPPPEIVEKRLRIQDMKRVMIPLVPGQEIPWATLMEQVVNRGFPGEEALALQALIPQLAGHNEVVAQATSILVQAAGKPYQERQVLNIFFEWIRSKYQLSPRQKRAIFARKLREMRWNWRTNPADRISSIISEVQLTWDDVANQPALREELEAALASKVDITPIKDNAATATGMETSNN